MHKHNNKQIQAQASAQTQAQSQASTVRSKAWQLEKKRFWRLIWQSGVSANVFGLITMDQWI